MWDATDLLRPGAWLICGVPFVMIEKVLVDCLTAGEAFLHPMPETNRVLAHLPAQVHFLAAEESREVHQSGVQVLHQASAGLKVLQDGTQLRGAAIPLRF